MPKRSADRESRPLARPQDLSQLRRESRTALELALVALAPSDLLTRLGAAAGLLEALSGLPADSPPVVALAPDVERRSRSTLEEWRAWQQEHLASKIARG